MNNLVYSECNYGFSRYEDGSLSLDAGAGKIKSFSALSDREKKEVVEDCLSYFYQGEEEYYTEEQQEKILENLIALLVD
jgi:hypothetical protein